jgi:hypothetical protein
MSRNARSVIRAPAATCARGNLLRADTRPEATSSGSFCTCCNSSRTIAPSTRRPKRLSDLPEPTHHHVGSQVGDAFRRQQRILESIFSDPSLSELRKTDSEHPAVIRYDAIEQLLREEGALLLPLHERATFDAAQQLLDAAAWIPAHAEEDVMALLPDEATRAHTLRRLQDASTFDDTMAELFFWGWLVSHDFEAERVEEEGISDIVIARGENAEVRADVKRIHAGTQVGRIARVINKANKQIKRSNPEGGGVAFISLETSTLPALPDDQIPSDIQQYVDAARQAMQSDNSSVGQAVLTWEDFIVHGEPPQPVGYYIRRRSVVVEHRQPLREPAIPSERLQVGHTAVMTLRFSPSEFVNQSPEDLLRELRAAVVTDELGTTAIRLSQHLKDHRRQEAVRPAHVEEAFVKPDSVAVCRMDDLQQAIVTKRITTAHADFLLVNLANFDEREGHWLLMGAYRLFGSSEELAELAADAPKAFATVLERYGTRFNVGRNRLWWVPALGLRIPGAASKPPQELIAAVAGAVGVRLGPEGTTFASALKVTSADEVLAGGMFWIHEDRYERALREAQRQR